jgi:hypothetical protein
MGDRCCYKRSRTREKIWVTMAGLTKLVRQSGITRAEVTGLPKTVTWTAKQIGLVGLAGLARLHGLAQAAARIDG